MQIHERAAVDPMSLILSPSAYRIWVEKVHPHVLKATEVQAVLQTLTPEEQNAALSKARSLSQYGNAVEDAMRAIHARGTQAK
jgi:hypothetical protein